jgi:hypothetical protein
MFFKDLSATATTKIKTNYASQLKDIYLPL